MSPSFSSSQPRFARPRPTKSSFPERGPSPADGRPSQLAAGCWASRCFCPPAPSRHDSGSFKTRPASASRRGDPGHPSPRPRSYNRFVVAVDLDDDAAIHNALGVRAVHLDDAGAHEILDAHVLRVVPIEAVLLNNVFVAS